ncbi:MAG: hypothetical protein H6739_31035 [Alphaproteobacteria bacterium]|nr:hypothetical protein [Alphaproteobacteria bacterium]
MLYSPSPIVSFAPIVGRRVLPPPGTRLAWEQRRHAADRLAFLHTWSQLARGPAQPAARMSFGRPWSEALVYAAWMHGAVAVVLAVVLTPNLAGVSTLLTDSPLPGLGVVAGVCAYLLARVLLSLGRAALLHAALWWSGLTVRPPDDSLRAGLYASAAVAAIAWVPILGQCVALAWETSALARLHGVRWPVALRVLITAGLAALLLPAVAAALGAALAWLALSLT